VKSLAGLLVALAVGGCITPSGDAYHPLSDAQAVRLARQYAAQHHIRLEGLRPGVGRYGTGISITFSDPACDAGCLDGLPLLFFIPAGQRRITHFQDGSV